MDATAISAFVLVITFSAIYFYVLSLVIRNAVRQAIVEAHKIIQSSSNPSDEKG